MLLCDIFGEGHGVVRTPDDVRVIRRDCKSPAQWQSQLLLSLTDSAWTLQMLVWLQVREPKHWFEILTAERLDRWRKFDPSFEVASDASSVAESHCGDDRERWLLLALKCLVARGWTRTMLAAAFGIPRTNIIRRLDATGEMPSEPDEIEVRHGDFSEISKKDFEPDPAED